MIKIELIKEVSDLHKKYFNDYIKPNLEKNNIKFIQQDIDDFNSQHDKKYSLIDIQQKHDDFIKLCLDKLDTIAIGDESELREFQNLISDEIKDLIVNKFMFYKKNSVSKKINGKDKAYWKLLFDKFGYEKFNSYNLMDTIVEYGEKFGRVEAGQKRYTRKEHESIIHKNMLKLLTSIFPEQSSNLNKELKSIKDIHKFKDKLKNLGQTLKLEITFNNYDSKKFLGIWNAYMFVLMSGIRVCPYCNRQYITPLFTLTSQMRADLDHFLPKSKYPYFSMSLFNLVPVCKACNSSLKRTKEFKEGDLNPYEESFDDYAQFYADISVNKPVHIYINKKKHNNDKINNYLNMFKLELQYNYHINQVEELIYKRLAYSEQLIEDLMKDRFKDSEITKEELKEFLIGYKENKLKINDEPLAKFKRDIVKQLNFFEDSNVSLINDLKEKLKDIEMIK